jgi:hypothetical protein
MQQMVLLLRAVQRFLREDVVPGLERAGRKMPDGRGGRGRRWRLGGVLGNGVLGKMTEMRTGRQVELLSELRTAGGETTLGGRRLSDSTMQDVLKVTEEDSVDHLLASLTRDAHRSKQLDASGLVKIRKKPVHAVMYDGQDTVRSDHEHGAPYARRKSVVTVGSGEAKVEEERLFWVVSMVHAVLASGVTPQCIGQRVAVDGNENRAVLELDDWVCRTYRWMQPGQVIKMADAKHSTTVFFDHQGDPYDQQRPGHYAMTALKGTHKEVYQEAVRALGLQVVHSQPAAGSDWEDAGHGRQVKRELWCAPTNIAAGVTRDEACRLDVRHAVVDEKQWGTLRLVVLVRQTTRYTSEEARTSARRQLERRSRDSKSDSGRHERVGDQDVHYRYFALNVHPNDISPLSTLRLVRMMWQVEVYHNQLAQHLHVKAGDWVCQGNGPAVVAGLAAAALNLLLLFQTRRLRPGGWRDTLSLPQLMQLFMVVVTAGAIAPVLEEKQQSAKETGGASGAQDELLDAEALDKRFSGEELDLLVLALKQLLKRVVQAAREWLRNKREQLQVLTGKLRGRPLLAH